MSGLYVSLSKCRGESDSGLNLAVLSMDIFDLLTLKSKLKKDGLTINLNHEIIDKNKISKITWFK